MIGGMRWQLLLTTIFSSALAVDAAETALLKPLRTCPASKSCGPVTIEAAYLYWQSKLFGLEYASKSFLPSAPGAAAQVFDQKVYAPDFAWKPGFKFDAGYGLPYDGWDIDACWTCYHTELTSLKKHEDSPISPAGLGIVPLLHYPFLNFTFLSSAPLRFISAAGNWKMTFNTLDAELGRMFEPTRTVPLRMHLGVKAAWIRQHYHVRYDSSTPFTASIQSSTQSLFILNSKMAFTSSMEAVGPRAGMNSKWVFGKGFSLIADGAFSCLYSFYDLDTKYGDLVANTATGLQFPNNLRMKEKMRELTPVIEAKLGLDMGWCFGTCRPIYFGAQIAYEAQYWWSINHLRRNYPYLAPGAQWDMRGDLQMQGLTASVRCDF